MGWGSYGESKGRQSLGYVVEGNVPVYQFTDAPTKVRFLTEDVSVEDVMAKLGMVREQAEEHVNTKMVHERWIMPVARWEHSIKEIPGKRFFSTVVCAGRGTCPLCAENDAAKENGVTENKLLPYPVRKRFFVPAYFYEMGKVLFVRGAEDFFDDVAKYVNREGSSADFEIWKTGKGFNTKYKSSFLGKGGELPAFSPPMLPKELDFRTDEAEFKRRIEGGPGAAKSAYRDGAAGQEERGSQPSKAEDKPPQAPSQSAGDFEVPFGSHKGKTLKQLYDLGEEDYVKFLAENAAGIVQEKAKAFLESKK